MSKKQKIEFNKASELSDIDAELDDALAKLEATTSRVDEILAAQSAAPPSTKATQMDYAEERGDEESGDSEEE